MNYDEMEAGPEMDKAIALWLGYTFVTFPHGDCPLTEHWSKPDGTLSGFYPPRFSADMGLAWQVVERITMPHSGVAHGFPPNTRFAHWWDTSSLWARNANQAALEICRAALKSTHKEGQG